MQVLPVGYSFIAIRTPVRHSWKPLHNALCRQASSQPLATTSTSQLNPRLPRVMPKFWQHMRQVFSNRFVNQFVRLTAMDSMPCIYRLKGRWEFLFDRMSDRIGYGVPFSIPSRACVVVYKWWGVWNRSTCSPRYQGCWVVLEKSWWWFLLVISGFDSNRDYKVFSIYL